MAKQVINIGTTANDGTGDPLRTAFDKVNDNFTELYTDDAGDVGSIIAGTGISVDQATGDVTVTNSSPDQTVALTDGTGITTSGTYPNFTITNSEPNATHTGDVTGSTALTIANDVVDHNQLAPRFTAKQDISTTSGTINLDASSYGIFEFTSDLTGSTTLNIQNIKKGQIIDILISGSQTITFSADFTTETFNKLAEVDYDGANDNHIQMICIDDNDSDAILNYSVASYASDPTP